MIIGIMGGSGSGKSTLCAAAREMGFSVVDADQIGHRILDPGTPAYHEAVRRFGPAIVGTDGRINRRALADLVFSSPEQLRALNEITYPRITQAVEQQLTANTVIDAAMLHQTPLIRRCDVVIAVTAPPEERIRRICQRDGISREHAASRIASQPTDEEYAAMANRVLHNSGDQQQFLQQARQTLREVMACQN